MSPPLPRIPRVVWSYTTTHTLPKINAWMSNMARELIIEELLMEISEGLIEALIMEAIDELEPDAESSKEPEGDP